MTADQSAATPAEAAGAPEAAPRKRWRSLVVLFLTAAVPAWILTLYLARGPSYLEANIDPDYAYLLNSLRIAEGHSSFLIHHPGTPVQLIGAAAIRATNVFEGEGTLRDHVLADPDHFLDVMRLTLMGVTSLFFLAAGALTLRATGSLLCAAWVQWSFLLPWVATRSIDKVLPEGLLMGTGALLSACLLNSVIQRPATRRPLRAAAMGALVALGVANKLLFVPIGIVPLFALARWRDRGAYLVSAAMCLALLLIPIAGEWRLGYRWFANMATHTGRYGSGSEGVVDLSAIPANFGRLARAEPACVALIAVGLAALFCALARGKWWRSGARATLAAVVAAQLLTFALILKHPAPFYFAPIASLAGLVVALVWYSCRQGPWRARIATPVFLTLLLGVAAWRTVNLYWYARRIADTAVLESPTAAFLRLPENQDVIVGSRISCPEAALQWGNAFASLRFGPDLERVYPGRLCWDWLGIRAFGRILTPEEEARLWSKGKVRVLVTKWFKFKDVHPKVTKPTVIRDLGGELLIEVSPPATPAPAQP